MEARRPCSPCRRLRCGAHGGAQHVLDDPLFCHSVPPYIDPFSSFLPLGLFVVVHSLTTFVRRRRTLYYYTGSPLLRERSAR